MTELAGLFVPLITPFTADGELATAALERLAHRVLDDGATGIVALGTTAEHATLTEAERTQVLQICTMMRCPLRKVCSTSCSSNATRVGWLATNGSGLE